MNARAAMVVVVILGALAGAVLIVARAPRTAAGPTSSAAYGH
jgi:hypothetical protein